MQHIKKISIILLFIIFNCNVIFAGYFDDVDWVSKSYEDGEPDYSDGDLEDKLGDSGYYYDLFPEERDGEPDDYEKGIVGWNYDGDAIYNSNNSNSKKNTDYNNPIIVYENNLNRYNTANDIKVYSAGDGGDIILIGDKIYYRHIDGIFHTGWLELNKIWYYFDPTTLELVVNELREINGKVYYLTQNGVMACNEIVTINGIKVYADETGSCSIVENN